MDESIQRCYYSNVARMMYRAPYCDILMTMSLKGKFSEADIRKALNKVRKKYPLINARIIQDEEGGIETVCDYTGDIPIFVYSSGDRLKALEIADEKQKELFDLTKGPLIKFVMISGEKTELVVIGHHYISDGLSLTYLLQDIARALQDIDIIFETMPIPLAITKENLIEEATKGKTGILLKLLINTLNGIWRKSKTVYKERDYELFYRDYWQKTKLTTLLLTVDKQTLSDLILKCKAEGVSVTAALATAFSLSLAESYTRGKKPPNSALLAISARNLFKEPETDNFGFLAFGNQLNLPKRQTDFWGMAQVCNKGLKKMLNDPVKSLSLINLLDQIEPTLIDAMYFAEGGYCKNLMARLLYNIILANKRIMRRSLDITNLGVVKNEDPLIETIFFVPMLSSYRSRTLGIITINGELNISILCEKTQDQDQVMIFKDNFIKYLKDAL